MEEEKKKFLLSRIKRQEKTINSDYNKFRDLYFSKNIKRQTFNAYTQNLKLIMTNTTSLAIDLHEYLQKRQVQSIFQWINGIFQDLLGKFKDKHTEYMNLQNANNSKEYRLICQVCQQKFQKKKISSIQEALSTNNECTITMLKNMIQQSENEWKKPLFTHDQDMIFKQNLDKIFQDKERLMFMSFRESDNFIEVVEKQITNFMADFRKQISDYENNKPKVKQNEDWGNMMKGLLSKKLTNSFQGKMPNFIHKMFNIFLKNIHNIPKPASCSLSTQTVETMKEKQNKQQQTKGLKEQIKIKNEILQNNQIQIKKLSNQRQYLKKQIQKITSQFATKMAVVNYKSKKDVEMLEQKYGQVLKSKRNLLQQQRLKQEAQQTLKQQQVRDREQQGMISLQQQEKLRRLKKKLLKGMKLNNSNSKKKITASIADQTALQQAQQQGNNENLKIQQPSTTNIKSSLTKEKQQSQSILKKDTSQRNSKMIVITNQSKVKIQQKVDQTYKLKKKVYKREDSIQIKQSQKQLKQNNVQQLGRQKQQAHRKSQLKNHVRQVSRNLEKDIQEFKRNHRTNHKSSLHHSGSFQQYEKSGFSSVKSNDRRQSIQNLVKEQQQVLITNVQSVIPKKLKNHTQNERKLTQFNQTLEILLNMEILKDSSETTKKSRLLQLIEEYMKASEHIKRSPQKECSLPKIKTSLNGLQNHILDDLKNFQMSKVKKQAQKGHKSMYFKPDRHSKNDRSKKQSKNDCSITFPSSNSLENLNSQKAQNENSIFVADIVGLFKTKQIALEYQNDNEAKHSLKPTPSQLQQIEHVYSIMQGLNKNHPEVYHQISSFVKQPSTALKNNKYKIYDYKDKIQFSSFCNHFMKIMWLHRNCKRQEGKVFCRHIQRFIERLNIMMLAEPSINQMQAKRASQMCKDKSNSIHVKENLNKS